MVCDCHLEWLPSINEQEDRFRHSVEGRIDDDDHVRVGDLAELECLWKANVQEETSQDHYVLVSRVPRDKFLCSYTTHCFDLCRCCDFYACDCRMQCPSGCTCQHDATWSQNKITCSNGNQTQMPLLIPMDSTSVHLDGNNYDQVGQQHFLGRQRVRELYLNNSGVISIAENAFTGLTGLQKLQLSSNPLRELRGQEFSNLYNLRELHLDNCELTYIGDFVFEPLTSLETLRLDGNLLTTFPVWRLSSNRALASLTLSANLWSCECEFVAPFNAYLEANIPQIRDYEQVQCVSENAVEFDGNRLDLCKANAIPKKHIVKVVEAEDSSVDLAAILVPTLMACSVIVIGFLAVFVFRTHIKTWLYNKSSKDYESRYNSSIGTDSGLDDNTTITSAEPKMFDLYVSYAKANSDFVDHNLAPTLEHSPRATYRLCLHHRDAPKAAADTTYDISVASFASESSSKILIVMSKEYLSSEWPVVKGGILENVARSPMGKLVILTIDDLNEANIIAEAPELLACYRSGPLIKWGSPGFIDKLRFFLPESVHATFQRNVTLRTIQHQTAGRMVNMNQNVEPRNNSISPVYGPPQSEHLYHYIPENHVYHTLEPVQLMNNLRRANMIQHSKTKSSPAVSPGFVLKLDNNQSFDNLAMQPNLVNTISQNLVCHTHSLSASSGTRLLTSPEEYIV